MQNNDLISREALLDVVGKMPLDWEYGKAVSDIYDIIKEAPAVDAVVLPCKPGTTVYEIHNNTDACMDCRFYSVYINDEDCTHPEHETYYPTIQDSPVCEKHFWEVISYAATERQLFDNRGEFGKTIFLTQEEAEAALAKTKGGAENA